MIGGCKKRLKGHSGRVPKAVIVLRAVWARGAQL